MRLGDIIKRLTEKENLSLRKKIMAVKKDIWFYNKFFRSTPRKLFIPLSKYKLGKKKVLDVACGYGTYLIRFGKGSVGVDLSEKHIDFLGKLDIKVLKKNIESDFEFRDEFDAVWASDIFEHVFSPHLFLLHCKEVLKKNGLLFISVPLIPKNLVQRIIPKYLFGLEGYKSNAHINAFTKESVCFMIERAGFKIIEASPFYIKSPFWSKLLSPLMNYIFTTIVVVAKIDYEFEGVDVFPPEWIDKKYDIHKGFDYKTHYTDEKIKQNL